MSHTQVEKHKVHESDNFRVRQLDAVLAAASIRKADLVVVKDVLQHLSNMEAEQVLNGLVESACEHILIINGRCPSLFFFLRFSIAHLFSPPFGHSLFFFFVFFTVHLIIVLRNEGLVLKDGSSRRHGDIIAGQHAHGMPKTAHALTFLTSFNADERKDVLYLGTYPWDLQADFGEQADFGLVYLVDSAQTQTHKQ